VVAGDESIAADTRITDVVGDLQVAHWAIATDWMQAPLSVDADESIVRNTGFTDLGAADWWAFHPSVQHDESTAPLAGDAVVEPFVDASQFTELGDPVWWQFDISMWEDSTGPPPDDVAAFDESIVNDTRFTDIGDAALWLLDDVYYDAGNAPLSDDLPADESIADDTQLTDIGDAGWWLLDVSLLAEDVSPLSDDLIIADESIADDTQLTDIGDAGWWLLDASLLSEDVAPLANTDLVGGFDAGAFDGVGFWTGFVPPADESIAVDTQLTDIGDAALWLLDASSLAEDVLPLAADFAADESIAEDTQLTDIGDAALWLLDVSSLAESAGPLSDDFVVIIADESIAEDTQLTDIGDVRWWLAADYGDTEAFALGSASLPITAVLTTTESSDLAQFTAFIYTPVYYSDTELLRVDYERRAFVIPVENRVVMMPAKIPTPDFVVVVQPEQRSFLLPPKDPVATGDDFASSAGNEPRRRP
jgi:hypothetical protein